MSKLEDEVRALRAELDALKPTPMPTEADVARHRDEMRAMEDRRALRDAHTFYSPADLAAMRAACPDAQAIVRDQRGAPQGGASIIPSTARATNIRPSGGTGWQNPSPIRNGLGQGK